MLLDMVSQYDEEKRAYFCQIWEKVILQLSASSDYKKIVSFLGKVGVISIDEKEKCVYVGVPNEFVMTQVKKFFLKTIKEAIHIWYHPQFTVKLVVYAPFQKVGNNLLCNLNKVLKIPVSKKKFDSEIKPAMRDELSSYFGILFDPIYRFDTFVAGGNNNFAFSAAKAVSENPGKVYNPLFLYGNVGLGKTHLMQAIGNHIINTASKKVVLYLPTSKLVDEIIAGIRNNKLNNLMRKLDDVDVLLIDDIQFLAGADKTQEIFHNIFNDFHMKKKQVILSSDRPPKELINIASRLRSRFSLGLVSDIQAPDYETRIAILQSKMASKDEDIDFEHLSTIAKHVKDNVRELEGALNILITRKKLMKTDLTDKDVVACLKTLGYSTEKSMSAREHVIQSNTKSMQNFWNLVDMVAKYYNIAVADLKSDSRKKEITLARQILMILAKKYFDWTLVKIGDYFGWKNHASVIYAVNNIQKKLKIDQNISHDYQVFVDRLEG